MTRADARAYLERQAARYEGTPWGTLAAYALKHDGLAWRRLELMDALDLVAGQVYGVVAVANRMRLADDDELMDQIRLLRADARQHGDEKLYRTCTRAIEDLSLRAIRICERILTETRRSHLAASLERKADARARRRVDTLLNQVEYEREHP